MLDSLNRYVAALLAGFRGLASLSVLGPFLILAAVEGLVLWALTVAASPTFGGWPIEMLRWWFGPAVGHYPAHYVLLPYMFFRIAIVLYGFVGVVVYAAVTGVFARRFTGEWSGPGGPLATAFSRFVPMFVIWLVATIVVFYGISRIPDAFKDWTFGSPRREVFIDVLARVVVILFMSFWAYTTVALVVERSPLLTAVRASVRRFLRRPLATFFLLGIPYVLTVPFSLLASKSENLATHFRPETVVLVLVLVIISQLVANILTSGAVTHYYLSEPARE